ncbi:cysteine ABC transporter permease, partial [Burkholderia cenocepacia]
PRVMTSASPLSVLPVPEIFHAVQVIAAVTFGPPILYTAAALIYLLFSSVLSTLQRRLETHFVRHALFHAELR